ncbi:hypothetical protein ZEAMMB73_Zm00001d012044 [Zea mays]|uniref:Uncharacterized protein n=1 Tax=Zea mays TaxID=4577 RepID=A0A1D6G678_MAIZE|nr:hypothetical protein ZEAMMB73_Zm00001d012044 [Zea mays]
MPLRSCLMAAGFAASRPLMRCSWRWRTATRSTPCFTRPEAAFLAPPKSLVLLSVLRSTKQKGKSLFKELVMLWLLVPLLRDILSLCLVVWFGTLFCHHSFIYP